MQGILYFCVEIYAVCCILLFPKPAPPFKSKRHKQRHRSIDRKQYYKKNSLPQHDVSRILAIIIKT